MERFWEAWYWTEKIGGKVMIACLFLYAFRCGYTVQLLSLEQFSHFLWGLLAYLFS